MKKTITGVALCALLLALGFPADAQQLAKIPRIGFLSGSGDPNTPGLQLDAFRRGLRELGYIEGKNILVEYRYVEGRVDRIPSLVAELMQLKVDVFISGNLVAIRAAKQATKTIPIVMVSTADPVTAGLIDSLARPGGNITGRPKRKKAGISQGGRPADITGWSPLGHFARTGGGECF